MLDCNSNQYWKHVKTSCKGRRHSAFFRFIDYRNFCIYLMISILVNDLPKLSYLWCHRLLGKFVVSKHCFRISFELLVNAFKEDFHFNSKGLWDLTEVGSFLTALLSPLESWWSYFLSVSFLPSRPSRPTMKKVWFSVSAVKIIRTGTPVSKTTGFKEIGIRSSRSAHRCSSLPSFFRSGFVLFLL